MLNVMRLTRAIVATVALSLAGATVALADEAPGSEYFGELEELAYSAVEHIPLVGTLYSIPRAAVAHDASDSKQFWRSVASATYGYVRDVVILFSNGIAVPAFIVHAVGSSFTDEMIQLYLNDTSPHRLALSSRHDPSRAYVVVADSNEASSRRGALGGLAKGVHHYFGAVMTGLWRNETGSRHALGVRLELPQGIYSTAHFSLWVWRRDTPDQQRDPQLTTGMILLEAAKPLRFKLEAHSGSGDVASLTITCDDVDRNHFFGNVTVEGGSEGYIQLWLEPRVRSGRAEAGSLSTCS